MAFYKDLCGLFCFILTHVFIFLQLFFILKTTDNSSESLNAIESIQFTTYLPFYKVVYCFITALTVISHINSSITEPGKIIPQNNPLILEFYNLLYKDAVVEALRYTREIGEKEIQRRIKEIHDENGGVYDISDDDDKEYEPITSIPDDLMVSIGEKYKMRLTRCRKCYVVRPNRAHHCCVCKCCILGMDHHCPWINNCVGQFNRKYFVLFLFYSTLGCILSIVIGSYYSIYKNYMKCLNEVSCLLMFIFQVIISLFFGIFTIIMLYEQKDNFENNSSYVDYRHMRLCEKREPWDEVVETFGENFGVNWFLPFKCGGFRWLYMRFKYKNKNE